MTVGAQQLHGAAWQRVSAALQRQTVGDDPVCAYVYDLDTVLSQVQAVRAALTGRLTSPGIFDVLAVLGREESLARIADQAESVRSAVAVGR